MLDGKSAMVLIGLKRNRTGTREDVVGTVSLDEARPGKNLIAMDCRGIGQLWRGSAPPDRNASPPERCLSGRYLVAQRDRLDFQKIDSVTPSVSPRARIDRHAVEVMTRLDQPAFVDEISLLENRGLARQRATRRKAGSGKAPGRFVFGDIRNRSHDPRERVPGHEELNGYTAGGLAGMHE